MHGYPHKTCITYRMQQMIMFQKEDLQYDAGSTINEVAPTGVISPPPPHIVALTFALTTTLPALQYLHEAAYGTGSPLGQPMLWSVRVWARG